MPRRTTEGLSRCLPVNSSYPPPILRSTVSKITALSPSSVSSDKRVEKAAETTTARNSQKNITRCLFVINEEYVTSN